VDLRLFALVFSAASAALVLIAAVAGCGSIALDIRVQLARG